MTDHAKQLDAALARADREGWRGWVRSVQDEHALVAGCYFDIQAAERVRKFIESFIKLADPASPRRPQPMRLMNWQWERVIAPLFGWKRPDGTRRFRHAWIEVAKKQGKSTLVAAIILYLLIADSEQEPEIYSVATTREQAGIIYREARKMLDKSPALQKYIEARDHVKRLIVPAAHGFYTVMANKPAAADGVNAHAVIYDEMHRQARRELYEALQYAGAARTQPLQIVITTAGDDRQSIGYELHERAEKIAKGSIIDIETLVYIAAADPDDDPGAIETWRKANPSLGVTVHEDELRAEYERAKDSPARLQNFRRLRLNQWVTSTSKWLDYDRWAACYALIDASELEGRECYGGLDLSSKTDLTAFVLQFPRLNADGQLEHVVLAWHWLPEENIEAAERASGMPYREWARMGLLELTPGDYVDYRFIRHRINELAKQYKIQQIAYDPAYCGQLALDLIDDGLECFEFWARPTMYNPVLRYLETAIYDGRLRHNNNPILNWQAGNIEVQENADRLIKPVKVRNAQKIDGIVALAMSMGAHCKQREEVTEIYDESPLIMIGG